MEFRGKYSFLSNFYPAVVYSYPSVEHAYQAAKTVDKKERVAIKTCATPAHAKRLGRKVAMRNGWNELKVEVMETLVKRKFENYPLLRQQLLATGDVELVEENRWHDCEWGCCICSRCKGRGKNRLGKILMRVRDELRDSNVN